MKWGTAGAVVVMFAALIFGSVLVFLVFDRSSNSASDTIRPFVITMTPLWGVAIAAAAVLLRKPRG
jgi:Na+-driven multidrug efflux pump